MERSRTQNYPTRHVSIRVPWHDSGWAGTVCQTPKLNGACLKLKNIGKNRKDDEEEAVAGQSLEDLPEDQWPCCISERAAFMAPFEYTRHVDHPYTWSSPATHGHFAPTPLRHPPYAAPAAPFLWMLREMMEEFATKYNLDVDPAREPVLGFDADWVQELNNQRAPLDCFFGHVRPHESLCFFYAKQVPFVEAFGRVLVGVGRVRHVGDGVEY